MAQRQHIRDAVKRELGKLYLGEIFTTRQPDLTDLDEAVVVVLVSGEVEDGEGLDASTVADLELHFYAREKTDGELDDWAAELASALAIEKVSDVVQGIFPGDWEYTADESGQFSGLVIHYSIMYSD